MSAFSLLYKVFYDKKAVSEAGMNGKGWGGKVLFALSVVVAVLACFNIYGRLKTLAGTDLSGFAARMPVVVFEKGEILRPENFKLRFVQKDFFIVVNTTDENDPELESDLPPVGLYVRRKFLTIRNAGYVQHVSYESLNPDGMSLAPEDIRPLFIRFVDALTKVAVFLSFVILVPFVFLTYLLFGYISALLSFSVTSAWKISMDFKTRFRVSVLAMIPALLLNQLAVVIGANIRLNWWQAMIITLVYLFCFVKDEVVQRAQNSSSTNR